MATATQPRVLRLKARDRVVLSVDALPALPAIVAATTPTEAMLVLHDAPVPARMLHRRAGMLEAAQDGRRYRGAGEMHMVARAGLVRDDAILFRFGAPAPAGSPARRTHERTPAVLPVTLVPMTDEVAPAHGLTLDLSPGGLLIRGPESLRRGSELLVHLMLPDEDLPIPAKGEVVRRAGDGLLGVRVDRMRATDRELVQRWLASRRTV